VGFWVLGGVVVVGGCVGGLWGGGRWGAGGRVGGGGGRRLFAGSGWSNEGEWGGLCSTPALHNKPTPIIQRVPVLQQRPHLKTAPLPS